MNFDLKLFINSHVAFACNPFLFFFNTKCINLKLHASAANLVYFMGTLNKTTSNSIIGIFHEEEKLASLILHSHINEVILTLME